MGITRDPGPRSVNILSARSVIFKQIICYSQIIIVILVLIFDFMFMPRTGLVLWLYQ